ncbi:MAG: 4Fe-4S dicluster domain-containing protein [Cyanobacteria bacterium HKST-UBA06]|nr:4Fe-4S dicluster domain-containing protein [Cyanobacteria bacterium HKST-UBA06]
MAFDENKIQYDVVLVGASTSNLALAHRLVDLASHSGISFSMAILEKAREFGGQILSGAVTPTHVIDKLFPDWRETDFPVEGVCDESHFTVMGAERKWDAPNMLLPAGLDKKGYLIITLSQVVAWMVDKLKAKLQDAPKVTVDFFNGFAAHEILYDNTDKVVGVRVSRTGIDVEDNIYAHVTVFGDKGFISQDLVKKFNLRKNPQLWSVGVKEVWSIKQDLAGKVWHTLGFPLLDGTFGGGFIYGMQNNRLTVGLVVSLDSENPNLNPQQLLQDYKTHPWLQDLLKDGTLLKYGAALLPEGGYFSLPDKFAVDGAMLLGDALGTLNVIKLAGVDHAMECGWQAAGVLHKALQTRQYDEATLIEYQHNLGHTFVMSDLHGSRYFRYTFQNNPKLLKEYVPKLARGIDNDGHPFAAAIGLGLMNPIGAPWDGLKAKLFLDGWRDAGFIHYKKNYAEYEPDYVLPELAKYKKNDHASKDTLYSREDAVFYAGTKYHEGNDHIDEFDADVCVRCIDSYSTHGKTTPCVSDCTAEVHRIDEMEGRHLHGMSLENCIHCRTCEIVCPQENIRVKPTYQGSGPDFMGL